MSAFAKASARQPSLSSTTRAKTGGKGITLPLVHPIMFPFCYTLPPRLVGFGGKGIRTPDFQLAKLALYQLSYAPAFRIAECRLAIADFKRNSFPGFLLSLLDLPPLPETVFGFNHNHIVFLDHRHQFLLEFFFPKFAFVELGLERVAAFEIGKSAHKEKGVCIFHR